jgi:hypothetical protein
MHFPYTLRPGEAFELKSLSLTALMLSGDAALIACIGASIGEKRIDKEGRQHPAKGTRPRRGDRGHRAFGSLSPAEIKTHG